MHFIPEFFLLIIFAHVNIFLANAAQHNILTLGRAKPFHTLEQSKISGSGTGPVSTVKRLENSNLVSVLVYQSPFLQEKFCIWIFQHFFLNDDISAFMVRAN